MTVIRKTEEKVPSGESMDNVYYIFNFYSYVKSNDSYDVILITIIVIVLIFCRYNVNSGL